MEDLLVCRVRRGTDGAVPPLLRTEILDVRKNFRPPAVVNVGFALSSALVADVRGDASINNNVFLGRVLVEADAAEDEEAAALVKFFGLGTEDGMQRREGEG